MHTTKWTGKQWNIISSRMFPWNKHLYLYKENFNKKHPVVNPQHKSGFVNFLVQKGHSTSSSTDPLLIINTTKPKEGENSIPSATVQGGGSLNEVVSKEIDEESDNSSIISNEETPKM